jgi:hypothetical protein
MIRFGRGALGGTTQGMLAKQGCGDVILLLPMLLFVLLLPMLLFDVRSIWLSLVSQELGCYCILFSVNGWCDMSGAFIFVCLLRGRIRCADDEQQHQSQQGVREGWCTSVFSGRRVVPAKPHMPDSCVRRRICIVYPDALGVLHMYPCRVAEASNSQQRECVS